MELIKARVNGFTSARTAARRTTNFVNEFARHGFEIVFDYAPNGTYQTRWGDFETNDGVLTAWNPRLG